MSIVNFQTVWIRLSHKCFFTFLIRIQNMRRQSASSQILELRVLDNRQVSFPCIHVLSLPFPSKRWPFQVIPLAFPSMGTPTSCRTPPYGSLLHTITGAPACFSLPPFPWIIMGKTTSKAKAVHIDLSRQGWKSPIPPCLAMGKKCFSASDLLHSTFHSHYIKPYVHRQDTNHSSGGSWWRGQRQFPPREVCSQRRP